MKQYESRYWDDIEEGADLPTVTKPMTATKVVSGAIASRDFYPVHHDFHFAQKAGLKDLIVNTPTDCGYISKYLTDWTGPEGELKRMAFRLGVPCFAGDALTISGKVAKKYTKDNQHLIDVEYALKVPFGNHCTGMATLALPARGS